MLHAVRAKLRRDAVEEYRFDTLIWALLAPHQKTPGQPPRLPDILRVD